MENNYKWYVIQIRGNKEKAVKERIEREVERNGYQNIINNVYLPLYGAVDKRKKKAEVRPLLKGMLFINCILDSHVEAMIHDNSDIFGFVGGKPMPIPVSQIKAMVEQSGCTDINETECVIKNNDKFEVGDEVTITDTQFLGMHGVVSHVNSQNGKIKVDINIFSVTNSVEFDKTQISHKNLTE